MTPTVKKSDKMAWGLTFLIFGILIMLEKLGLGHAFPFFPYFASTGTYFLIAGIIFLIYKKEKTLGLVFTIIGLIIHSDFFFGWMQTYRKLMLPFALIAVGLILVMTNRRS